MRNLKGTLRRSIKRRKRDHGASNDTQGTALNLIEVDRHKQTN